jgi:hypothetical protein
VNARAGLVRFLRARLDDDMRRVMLTPGGSFKVVSQEGKPNDEEPVQQYYHRFQPGWMGGDVAFKRWLVDWSEKRLGDDVEVLRALADVYSTHPDYDERWRP